MGWFNKFCLNFFFFSFSFLEDRVSRNLKEERRGVVLLILKKIKLNYQFCSYNVNLYLFL